MTATTKGATFQQNCVTGTVLDPSRPAGTRPVSVSSSDVKNSRPQSGCGSLSVTETGILTDERAHHIGDQRHAHSY